MNSLLHCAEVSTLLEHLRPKITVDPTSLCSLYTRKVSQSTNIRVGNELEKIVNLYILNSCPVTDMRPSRTTAGERQKDLCVRVGPSTVVYAELKSNINLDTEKCRATRDKVNEIVATLREQEAMEVTGYLVSLRYLRTSDVPQTLRNRYGDVTLIGVGDFFRDVLHQSVTEFEDYPTYIAFLMSVVDKLEPVA
jgi:hypothetical protein